MKTNTLVIEINNYDNAAMCDDPSGETIRILKGIIAGIEDYGVPNADGKRLMDSNGNQVGVVQVEFSEDDDEETDDDSDNDDDNGVDLSSLSENDLALHTSISSVLSCETSILDPDDADALALVIVNELPPVYNAAPELLEVLERCADFMGSVANGDRGPSKVSATFLQAYNDARAAIEKAKGD